MVVPDFELICEIMLVAEGFIEARLLARKFITLYTLCKELLSKQVIECGSAAPLWRQIFQSKQKIGGKELAEISENITVI